MILTNFLQAFKNKHSWDYFKFKVNFKVRNYVKWYKNLKIYCKPILNVFFNRKIFDDEIFFYLYDRFFVSNQNFTTGHVKIIKSSSFFQVF